jgi:hypothetical protein
MTVYLWALAVDTSHFSTFSVLVTVTVLLGARGLRDNEPLGAHVLNPILL